MFLYESMLGLKTGVRCKKKHRKTLKNKEILKKVTLWRHLGRALGTFWSLLGTLGALLGGLLEALETPLGHSWSLLGASWTPLGRNLEKGQLEYVFGGPTWRPKSIQVGSKIQEKSM